MTTGGDGPFSADASPLDAAVASRDRDTLAMVSRAVATGNAILAYQPVVDARDTNRIAFFEGLIRVRDETGRIIPAKDFIEQVEEHQIGRSIDCLALEHGLAALHAEPGLRLSVNMSARSIAWPAWTEVLERGLARSPTIAERLIVEITETSAMLMPEVTMVFMDRLQRQGISFALDDFGAGYTAFRYLRDFDFDVLKIAGEFGANVAENPDNRVLAEALVDLARHFDMFTVAEGIETAADAAVLQAAGVDCLQGFHYGVPRLTRPHSSLVSDGGLLRA